MSTIPSSLPAALAADSLRYQARAGRSLVSLSASTQPAAPADDGTAPVAEDDSVPAAQVERQNRLAALADSAAASAANQSALAALAARPAGALAAQGNSTPSAAWSLLQDA